MSIDNPGFAVAKIDIDELQAAAKTAQIASVPYVLVWRRLCVCVCACISEGTLSH